MESENKMLIEVKVRVNSEEAEKKIANFKREISDLRDLQKKLDTTTEAGRNQYEAYGTKIRELSALAREQQKVIDNNIKAHNEEAGSLQQLKSRLSNLTLEYNKLSKEQRNSADGLKLKSEIKGISDELKTAEGGVGNFRRSVGEYKDAIKQAIAGNNPFLMQILNISEGAKEAGTSFGKQGVEGVKSFGKSLLSLLANPIVAIIAGIVAVVMLLYNLFKDFDPIVDKVEQVFAALTAVWNTLKSTAQQLFSGVMSLKQAFSGLGKSMADAAAEAYKLKQAQQDLEDQQRVSEVNQKRYKNQIDELMLQSRNRTLSEKERMSLIDKAMNLEKTAYNERKIIADKDYQNSVQEAINNSRLKDFEKQQLKSRGVNYAIWLENKGKLDKEYTDKIKEAQGKQLDIVNEGIQFEEKAQNRRDQLQDKAEQKAEKAQQQAQQRAEKAQQQAEQNAQKQAEIAQRIATATNELNNIKIKGELNALKEISDNENKSYSDRFNAIYSFESKQKQLLEDNATFEKSKSDLTAKEIEVIEANKNQDIENLKKQTDKNIEALNKSHLQKTLDDIKNNANKQSVENTIAYEKELTSLAKRFLNRKISAEQYEKEKNDLILKYEKKDFDATLDSLQKQLDVEELTAQQKLDIQKAISEKKIDMAQKVADKQLDIETKLSEKTKELDKQLSDYKKELYSQLSESLADIFNSSYESRLQNLDAETQAVSDNATKQKDEIQAKEDAGTISKANAEKQKKAIDDKAKKDTDKLEAEKKKIAREQAIFQRAVGIFEIGVDTAKKVGAVQTTVGEIAANAALMASNPVTLPFVAQALAQIPIAEAQIPFIVGIGALQAAAALAQPLPKAELGMLVKGKSHAQGGVPVELEGGETVINKRSSSIFAPIISAINSYGGYGVPFPVSGNYLSDGGYSVRTYTNSNTLNKNDIADAMKEAVQELKIYTAIEDIKKADKKYTEIEQNANF